MRKTVRYQRGMVSAIRMESLSAIAGIRTEVLQLAPADRSRLFERLIASIDTDSAVEQAWEFEADRLSPYG